MNRCIHCTRCVRFATEVAGVPELGAIGRGEDMEITTYLEQAMTSELQGNVVDLCPVGALTSKPYAFAARPWELNKTESIDVMDAVGSAIRVDTRGREVMRILPRINEDVNEEWISDKTRHVVDGLRTQRLDQPYIRENGRLRAGDLERGVRAIAAKVKGATPERIGAIAGDLAAVEEMFALKDLMARLGSPNIDAARMARRSIRRWGRASYLFNATIAGIEQADALLIVGANPRQEAPVLNARIRKRWRAGKFPIGADRRARRSDLCLRLSRRRRRRRWPSSRRRGRLRQGVEGGRAAADRSGRADRAPRRRAHCCAGGEGRAGTRRGQGRLERLLRAAHRGLARRRARYRLRAGRGRATRRRRWRRPARSMCCSCSAPTRSTSPPGAFVVYIGTHGDRGAHRADVILPGAAYTEKSGIYVNTEGRVQMATRAAFPPGDAREDWAILRALSDHLGSKLPYDSLGAAAPRVCSAHPHLARHRPDRAGDARRHPQAGGARRHARQGAVPLGRLTDFYLTNPIARASAVMAECSALAARPRRADGGGVGHDSPNSGPPISGR